MQHGFSLCQISIIPIESSLTPDIAWKFRKILILLCISINNDESIIRVKNLEIFRSILIRKKLPLPARKASKRNGKPNNFQYRIIKRNRQDLRIRELNCTGSLTTLYIPLKMTSDTPNICG